MKQLVCITGAAGGLGRAFALACASRGWDVFLTDREKAGVETLAAALRGAYGTEVYEYACDLTEEAGREELFAVMRRAGLRFTMLINAAGTDAEGAFLRQDAHSLLDVVRLNVESALGMMRGVLELRDFAGRFTVVNVCSMAAFYQMPYKAVYAASKRFLLDFSMAMRSELAPAGVGVCALCPAGMPTNRDTRASIDALGAIGRLTTKNTGYVAAKTIEAALRGRAVYVPGALNRLVCAAAAVLPKRVVRGVIGRFWSGMMRNANTIRTALR